MFGRPIPAALLGEGQRRAPLPSSSIMAKAPSFEAARPPVSGACCRKTSPVRALDCGRGPSACCNAVDLALDHRHVVFVVDERAGSRPQVKSPKVVGGAVSTTRSTSFCGAPPVGGQDRRRSTIFSPCLRRDGDQGRGRGPSCRGRSSAWRIAPAGVTAGGAGRGRRSGLGVAGALQHAAVSGAQQETVCAGVDDRRAGAPSLGWIADAGSCGRGSWAEIPVPDPGRRPRSSTVKAVLQARASFFSRHRPSGGACSRSARRSAPGGWRPGAACFGHEVDALRGRELQPPSPGRPRSRGPRRRDDDDHRRAANLLDPPPRSIEKALSMSARSWSSCSESRRSSGPRLVPCRRMRDAQTLRRTSPPCRSRR